MSNLLWFRNDLRLHDNPAFWHAAKSGEPLLLVYIDDNHPHPWQTGAASRWWLRHSLLALQQSLKQTYQAELVIVQGDPLTIMQDLIKQHQIQSIYWNRCYEPYTILRDKKIKVTLEQQGNSVHSFNGFLLKDPFEIANKQGTPFKVFTPFLNHLKQQIIREPLALPKKFKSINYPSADIDSILPLPNINWYKNIENNWQIGEAAAKNKLAQFLKQTLRGYDHDRDVPALPATSRLSPHLHFGEISPVQIWHATHTLLAQQPNITKDGERFLAELAWREFSWHLLYHFPQLPDQPIRTEFKHFAWKKNQAVLKKWQQGLTGYPIVDAGMRQLWQIGWMHNRVRMIVASFLIKDLLIPWQQGEAWFWDTLVDADLANNAASWQWVAGCGMDAAPYFRIFNPILQGKKFDPNGDYIKQWVPELAKLDPKYIHAPWQAPEAILQAAHILLGKNYPKPIVDHDQARRLALEYYKKCR